MEVLRRLFDLPSQSCFILGPRGTGKTTFLKGRLPQAIRVDLLDPEQTRRYAAAPERLRMLVEAQSRPCCLVIDEIQRVPELLPVVHGLIDEQRGDQFVLTGSSARKLKQTGADLLAGRAILKSMHPFMAAELGVLFDLDRALRIGMLPIVLGSPIPEEVLRTYAALYLREEVQVEGLVRNIGVFSRFLEIISFSHASVLNISNVARECAVERKSVEGYVTILEDLLLAWRIPVFAKRARRTVSTHPKFYLFDAGVFQSLRPKGPLDHANEIGGQALEGLVAQHLRAWIAYQGKDWSLHFWRTQSGVEVDFVVYGQDGIWALEVKNTAEARSQDVRSLRTFREDYPQSHTALIYRGRERVMCRNVLCVPADEFLRQLRPDGPMIRNMPDDGLRMG